MAPAETPEGGGPASTPAFSIALSPQGHVCLDVPTGSDLAPSLAPIAKHFERGDGHGVFPLGAAEPETPLPGVLSFWRDVGRAFVVRLCATEDLETLRAKIEIEVPPDELAAPNEISFQCSCPDWAGMCKHVAATLYGVGVRLEEKPELFFELRGVDHTELVGGAADAAPRLGDGAKGRRGGQRRRSFGAVRDRVGVHDDQGRNCRKKSSWPGSGYRNGTTKTAKSEDLTSDTPNCAPSRPARAAR